MIPNESIKATNISKIPIDELNSRRKKCIEKMQEDGLDCMVFFLRPQYTTLRAGSFL